MIVVVSRNNHNSCCVQMPDWVNKILKHNPGEKSLKKPFTIYLDSESLSKKEQSHNNNNNNSNNNNNNNNIEESYTEKKLDMNLLVGQFLQDVRLIKKKINLITTEEKIVLKNYVKN